jgi:hypothetical protein
MDRDINIVVKRPTFMKWAVTMPLLCLVAAMTIFSSAPAVLAQEARNPIIWADVPDVAMIRVGDTYYMSSTTMHMSPGVPIMKSKDLVNWELVRYAYDILDDVDDLNLANGKNTYGRGSWASSIRYHNGTYYVSTFAQTTGKTYIYTTKDIEKGLWKVSSFRPAFHDHSLFFDDDGRVYLLYGAGDLRLVELTADATAVKPGGFHDVIIRNASAVSTASITCSISRGRAAGCGPSSCIARTRSPVPTRGVSLCRTKAWRRGA